MMAAKLCSGLHSAVMYTDRILIECIMYSSFDFSSFYLLSTYIFDFCKHDI